MNAEQSPNTCPMFRDLHCDFDDQIGVICDGMYAYIQRSGDNMLQRMLYSVQKGRHLINPMVIIATDGYIVDIFGPFSASKK